MIFLVNEGFQVSNKINQACITSVVKKVKRVLRKERDKKGQIRYVKKDEVYFSDRISVEDLLKDCVMNISNAKGDFHKMIKYNKKEGKGVSIVAKKDNIEYEVMSSKSLEKLSPRQLMFFTLYNAPDYKDLVIDCTTYLDEVACWLVSYGFFEETYKKYGTIIKRRLKKDYETNEAYQEIVDSEGHTIAGIGGVSLKDFHQFLNENFICRKGNFVFNSQADFVKIKNLAKSIVNSLAFKEAQKELIETNLGDTQTRIQDYYLKLDEIYKNTNDPKVRLECLKLGGKWLGMEQINISTEQNHVIKGLQVAIANGDLKDFDFDEDLFEKVE